LSEPRLLFPPEPLSDGHVTLRAWREDDLPALVEMCRDPEVPRWTRVPEDYSLDDAREWQARKSVEEAAGLSVHFAIVDAGSGELLGSCGMHATDRGAASIGYLVGPGARRRGVATRAARLLAAYGLRDLGLPRVELCTDPDNVSSQGVAEAAGFRREGLLRAYLDIKGRRRDAVMFGLVPDDLGSAP
jgi:[ribosomal protein S5]-alanine N-acetyltransferase